MPSNMVKKKTPIIGSSNSNLLHHRFRSSNKLRLLSKYILTLIVVLFFIGQSHAQRMMILQRGGNQKSRIVYEVGDEIKYRQKGVDYFFEDVIREIHRDFLVLTDNIIRPEDIAVVDIRRTDPRNHTIRNLSALAFSAGALWLTAETINSLYIDGRLQYSNTGLILAGSLFTGSAIISLSKYRYFKHEGRNKIQIIILEED